MPLVPWRLCGISDPPHIAVVIHSKTPHRCLIRLHCPPLSASYQRSEVHWNIQLLTPLYLAPPLLGHHHPLTGFWILQEGFLSLCLSLGLLGLSLTSWTMERTC